MPNHAGTNQLPQEHLAVIAEDSRDLPGHLSKNLMLLGTYREQCSDINVSCFFICFNYKYMFLS